MGDNHRKCGMRNLDGAGFSVSAYALMSDEALCLGLDRKPPSLCGDAGVSWCHAGGRTGLDYHGVLAG